MQTKAAQRWIDRIIIAVMAALGVVMLLPFAWLFSMSFRAPAEDAMRKVAGELRADKGAGRRTEKEYG